MSNFVVVGLAALVMTGCGGNTSPTADEGTSPVVAVTVADVSVSDFAALYDSSVTLIDVRTPQEYAAGRVPGAVLVPMDVLSPTHATLAAHPKSEPLYLICHSGGRSARAAKTLAAAGFNTVNVLGGTAAWIAGGHDVER